MRALEVSCLLHPIGRPAPRARAPEMMEAAWRNPDVGGGKIAYIAADMNTTRTRSPNIDYDITAMVRSAWPVPPVIVLAQACSHDESAFLLFACPPLLPRQLRPTFCHHAPTPTELTGAGSQG